MAGGSRWDDVDRRQELLKAATASFASRGYDATTVRQLADDVGCAKGLIHHYFGGKAGLLTAVLDERRTLTEERVRALPEQPTVQAEVEQYLLWNLESTADDIDAVKVLVARTYVDGSTARDFASYRRVREDTLVERFERYQARGEIRADVDLRVFVKELVTVAYGLALPLLPPGDSMARLDRLRELATSMAALVAHGVTAASHRPS